MKLKLILKSGYEIPIVCEKMKFTTHNMTGELTAYEIEKAASPGVFPRYVDVKEIAAILQIPEGEKEDRP